MHNSEFRELAARADANATAVCAVYMSAMLDREQHAAVLAWKPWQLSNVQVRKLRDFAWDQRCYWLFARCECVNPRRRPTASAAALLLARKLLHDDVAAAVLAAEISSSYATPTERWLRLASTPRLEAVHRFFSGPRLREHYTALLHDLTTEIERRRHRE